MAVIDTGSNTAGKANVDANFNLNTTSPGFTDAGVARGGGPANGQANFSENDPGEITGTRAVASPETDADFRLRTALETLLDTESFSYPAQNTGKHLVNSTTMTALFTTAGLVLNGTSITTLNTGVQFGTYAYFPLLGVTNLYCETELAFSAQPTAGVSVTWGTFLQAATVPFEPIDGACFRLTSAGLEGVIYNNGIQVATVPLPFTYINNQVHQYIIATHERRVRFWINNVLYGDILTPFAQGRPYLANALPFSISHANVGTAGGAIQTTLRQYTITLGGHQVKDTLGTIGNRIFGSHQGLSGGVMGSLANFANNSNPTASVPTNTATNNSGLGGQCWETDTLAANTDGIVQSYQVPLGTVAIQGKRLRVNGVKIDSFVQTALTGGGYNAVWTLAFGHTAVSLATVEAVAAKAPRRVPIGSNSVVAAAAALTQLATIQMSFMNPIYVNPGEFIATVKKKIGAAPSAGVIAHSVTFDYSWE